MEKLPKGYEPTTVKELGLVKRATAIQADPKSNQYLKAWAKRVMDEHAEDVKAGRSKA